MTATIVYGKDHARTIHGSCERDIARLREQGVTPGLAMVLVGDDQASLTYIGRKRAACRELGIKSFLQRMDAMTSTAKVLDTIAALNADPHVHGILVQQPLPPQVDVAAVVAAVEPAKDVDGLHPHNVGLLAVGASGMPVACTPRGCLHLLREIGVDPVGLRATVIGRSMIVGRPLALLLDRAGASVSVCHRQTRDLAAACRLADILAVSAGCAGLVTADMVKPGATVLDIGINRTADGKLVGDIDFAGVCAVAANVTPVPGGIGPLTVAMLMRNTITVAGWSAGRQVAA